MYVRRKLAMRAPWVAILAVATGASVAPRAEADGTVDCRALQIEPASPSVVTGGAVELRAVGGSGHAVFHVVGKGGGAWIEPGGGLHAGDHPGRVEVVAQDALCGTEARQIVNVTPRQVPVEPRSGKPTPLRPRVPILAV